MEMGEKAMVRARAIRGVLAAGAFLSALCSPGAAHATSFTVETTSVDLTNDGLCSLREAIQASNTLAPVNGLDDCPAGTGDDTILLPPGTYTSSVTLTVSHKIQIVAAENASNTIIKTSSGFAASQLLSVTAGGNLSLNSVTLQRGGGVQTRGIYGSNARISLSRSVVTGFTWSGVYTTATSSSTPGAVSFTQTQIKNNSTPFDGGGIFNTGFVALDVTDSTINNNTATGKGGGIYHSGSSSANIDVSTICDNSAANGGGFYNQATGGGGNYVNSRRLTITNNSASVSGGGAVENTTTGNNFLLAESIVANNTAPSNPNFEGEVLGKGSVFGALTAGATILVDPEPTPPNLLNVTSTQLKLGPLMDMGGWFGSTPTRPLLKGSVAIDFIDPAFFNPAAEDQRGLTAQDGDGNGSVRADAGAHEVTPLCEAEIFGFTEASDNVDTDAASGYSGGYGSLLYADAAEDYVTLPFYVAEAGNYNVVVGYKKTNDGGKVKVGTSTTTTGFTEYTTTTDLYYNGTAYSGVAYATRAFTVGKQYLRVRVTGKNTSSSGYRAYVDYIKLTKV